MLQRHEHAAGLDADHMELWLHLVTWHDFQDGIPRTTPLDELVRMHRRDHGDSPGDTARGLFQTIVPAWPEWPT